MPPGVDEHVHGLHRNGSQKNLVAEHHSSCESVPSEHLDTNGSHIVHDLFTPFGQFDHPLLHAFQFELESDALRYAQVCGAGVDTRIRVKFLQIGLGRVGQADVLVDDSHGYSAASWKVCPCRISAEQRWSVGDERAIGLVR